MAAARNLPIHGLRKDRCLFSPSADRAIRELPFRDAWLLGKLHFSALLAAALRRDAFEQEVLL